MRHLSRTLLTGFAITVANLINFAAAPARAQDASYAITIRDGKLVPSTLNVKAGVKFQLTVTNATAKAVEFEISELNREKVVAAGSSATIYIGPLAPGSYPFFDDFNQSSKGLIVAK